MLGNLFNTLFTRAVFARVAERLGPTFSRKHLQLTSSAVLVRAPFPPQHIARGRLRQSRTYLKSGLATRSTKIFKKISPVSWCQNSAVSCVERSDLLKAKYAWCAMRTTHVMLFTRPCYALGYSRDVFRRHPHFHTLPS
jgi:hypothetical protein